MIFYICILQHGGTYTWSECTWSLRLTATGAPGFSGRSWGIRGIGFGVCSGSSGIPVGVEDRAGGPTWTPGWLCGCRSFQEWGSTISCPLAWRTLVVLGQRRVGDHRGLTPVAGTPVSLAAGVEACRSGLFGALRRAVWSLSKPNWKQKVAMKMTGMPSWVKVFPIALWSPMLRIRERILWKGPQLWWELASWWNMIV